MCLLQIAVSLNYNKVYGWIDFDSISPDYISKNFDAEWKKQASKYPMDLPNMKKLYEAVDVIGLSGGSGSLAQGVCVQKAASVSLIMALHSNLLYISMCVVLEPLSTQGREPHACCTVEPSWCCSTQRQAEHTCAHAPWERMRRLLPFCVSVCCSLPSSLPQLPSVSHGHTVQVP